jgi:hypothetical protein
MVGKYFTTEETESTERTAFKGLNIILCLLGVLCGLSINRPVIYHRTDEMIPQGSRGRGFEDSSKRLDIFIKRIQTVNTVFFFTHISS